MKAAINLFTSVFPIAEQRPSCICHLDANLMSTAGQKTAFNQRQTGSGHQHLIFGDSASGTGFGLRLHIDLILDCVFEELIFQLSVVRLWTSIDGTEIVFFNLPVPDLLIQDP